MCRIALASFRSSNSSLSVTVVPSGNLCKSILHLWVIVRKIKLINISVHLVCPEISVRSVRWHCDCLVLINEFITQLDRKAEV